MYHKQLVERLEKDPNYQQLTTNKLNQILHQTGKLLLDYILQRTNERAYEVNTLKYKVGSAFYADRSKAKREKVQLELLIKVVDYIIDKFGLKNELSNLFD